MKTAENKKNPRISKVSLNGKNLGGSEFFHICQFNYLLVVAAVWDYNRIEKTKFIYSKYQKRS
jgi:hypothetical protein